MLYIEKQFIKFCKKNYLILGYIFVSIMAFLARYSVLSFESEDYVLYLSEWFDYLKDNGGLLALASYQGNYNAPYVTIMALLTYIPVNSLYLIKFVSIVFDYGLAISSALLVKYLVKDNKDNYAFFAYLIILFLPEVIMNSAVWGQCDAGYAMFVVLALLFLLKEKYVVSFIHLGLAFSLKLQFIFILPLFIIVYIVKKKYSLFHFYIIPLVNFILCLPAIIIGKPIAELIAVYFIQVKEYSDFMSLNFLNIYALLGLNGNILYHVAIIGTIMLFFAMLMYICIKKIKFNDQKMLNLGLWSIVIATSLLPCMHERYLFLGGILAVIYYLVYKENFLVMLTIIFCSIITYFRHLFGLILDNTCITIIVLVYMGIVIYYTKDLLYMLRRDNE